MAVQFPKDLKPHRRASSAFTLVELIVIVAVLVVLMSMLVPTLGAAREQARRTSCASNLRQQGNAYAFYVTNYAGSLPFTLWFHQNNAFDIVQKSTLYSYTNNSYKTWLCPEFIRYGRTPTGVGGNLSFQFCAEHYGGGYASRLPGQRLCSEMSDTDASTGGFSGLVMNNINHPSFVMNQLCNIQGTTQMNVHYGFNQKVINKVRIDVLTPDAVLTSEQYVDDSSGSIYGYFGDRWHFGNKGNMPDGGNILFVNGSVAWSKNIKRYIGNGFMAVVP